MATPPLPKRYAPFLQQAQTQTALRYGATEDQIGSLLAALAHDYGQQAQAQRTASMSVLGALQGADANLQKTYTESGLTPSLLSEIGNSPTGQRLAGELASGRAGLQSQLLGQMQGDEYQRQHIADNYQQAVGKASDSLLSLEKEKGLFGQSLFDSLVQGDHKERHDANTALRAQAHADTQAALAQQNSQDVALIGQGLLPGADGTLQPLPGGKADPNAKSNKPKRTTGAGTASPEAQRSAGTSFTKALALAQGMTKGKAHTPEVRSAVGGILANGKPATQGKVVYEDVPIYDKYDKTKVVGHKRQAKLDPATGQQITSASRPAIPAFDAPIAAAATEQALFGYVTTATVQKLQKLGYSVNQIPGLMTENQARASRPRQGNTAPPTGRPTAGT